MRRVHVAVLAAGFALAALVLPRLLAAAEEPPPEGHRPLKPGKPPPGVVTPNGASLPFREVDGWKVFHLVAEPVEHEFAPGLVAHCWGYNGRVHGPTIEAVEGDRVRVYVTNRLPAPTTVHWHGLHVPNGMDGVAGLTQRAIEPGETFRYEFPLVQHGTFMYHSHHDEMVQMAMGLMGLIVVHPRAPARRVDRDYAILLSEWAITPGARRPDPLEMTEFNVLTFNGKVFPATAPLHARVGERVRVRIGNLSATDHHPIHLHGHAFRVVETDGGEIPEAGRWPETTVLVPVGSTRTIEFVAERPGDWAFHCHMTHHTMNQMGHDVPNLVGVDQAPFDQAVMDVVSRLAPGAGEPEVPVGESPKNTIAMLGAPGPFGYIAMGGMFTVLRVRDSDFTLAGDSDYAHPKGTVAGPAAEDDLRRDGVDPALKPGASPAAPPGESPAPAPSAPPAPGGHGHGR